MATAQSFIYLALRKCGQLRAGYADSPEMLADGLAEFLLMYDGWNARRTLNYTIPDYIYPIASTGLAGIYGPNLQFTVGPVWSFAGTTTGGQAAVQVDNTTGIIIGMRISGTGVPAGAVVAGFTPNVSMTMSLPATASGPTAITVTPDFVGPRPEAIVRMNLWMNTSSPSNPTRIPLSPISAEEWANISVLNIVPINVTTVFYYDPQFPNGVINVWPPLNGNSLEFFTWGFLSPPNSLTSLITLPPGYGDLILWTLAKRLWPMCDRSLMVNKVSHTWLCGQAAIARAAVQAVNAPMPRLACDFQSGHPTVGVCDWNLLLTGQPY